MDLSNVVILIKAGGESVETPAAPQENANNEQQAQTAAAAGNAPQTQAGDTGNGLGPGFIIFYIVALIALFYFFAIRPQKKREKELSNIQKSIQVGDWVMTSSGFYGKVVDIADQVFVVEFGTNKGVRIPIRKSEIIGNKEPNLTMTHSEIEEKQEK